MIQSTKGIVLRTVKYGETSVIASIFTEHFGIQSYIVNGVRTQAKTSKAHFFQPSSILDMQVYHNELRSLHRIKELKWSYLYKAVLSNVIKNAVALYMVELLYKCLKQPEPNPVLFNFCEDTLIELDTCSETITANLPIYFSMQLAGFFGFRLQNNYSVQNNMFNPAGGNFTNKETDNEVSVSGDISKHISSVLKAQRTQDLSEIKLNKNIRLVILSVIEKYYAIHIQEFGTMKTLPVLHTLL